jgi:hypothetical protein
MKKAGQGLDALTGFKGLRGSGSPRQRQRGQWDDTDHDA